MHTQLNPQDYYRFPWSLTDNGISWIEVTNKCNLACEGCYRDQKGGGHKTLEEIAEDLAVFKKNRNSDCMSIAGGDPLVHPQIVEIVQMIKEGGWKPILNTNGLALTTSLLHDLKKAGLFGFTFHIDTSQRRKDSPNAIAEQDHNALRQKFAEMLAREGGLSCSFNQTVNFRTLEQIPSVMRWAQQYPEIVHTMVFILYREPGFFSDFDYYANGKKINMNTTYENTGTGWGSDRTIKAHDLVKKLRSVDPTYQPSAYLNGTVDPNSFKWLVGLRVASGAKTFGWVSPKFMEIVQHGSHILRGKWLSYSSPSFLGTGKLSAFAFGLFDKGMRKIAKNYLKTVATKPLYLFKKLHLQAYMIIQPVDLLADGRMNMCDGCPDMTVHKGKLYWSCRLEEIKQYGCFVTPAPKQPPQEHTTEKIDSFPMQAAGM